MKVILFGKKQLNFKTSNGDVIQGTQLFYGYTNDSTDGYCCDKVFIKPEIALPENLKPNDFVNLYFDHHGKVEAVAPAK